MAAKRLYQWEEWFGRRRTVLVRGVNYDCSQSTMAQMVRNNATRLGVRVRVLDTRDAVVVEVVGRLYAPREGVVGGAISHTDPTTVSG